MKKLFRQTSLYLGAALLISTSAASQAAYVVYAVDSSQDALYTLDLATGSTSLIGDLNPDPARYTTPVSMAIRPSDGTIFVNNNSPAQDDVLATVDATTGLATSLGGGGYLDGALAFDDSNNLYAADGTGALAIISQTDGSFTSIGGASLPRLFGLDYNSADGLLYGITGSASALDLLKINPTDGSLVSTLALSQPLSGSAAGTLMFDWNGILWGTTNGSSDNLFQIDTATGNVSNFRSVSFPFSPQGMGYVEINPVPVPAAVWLFGTALIGLVGLGKRKKAG